MPTTTLIQRRDRALVAFTILTGMRDNAIASLRLKHVDLDRELVVQDPNEVRTKFSKRIITYFFPVGEDLKQVVLDWLEEHMLTTFRSYGSIDPHRQGELIKSLGSERSEEDKLDQLMEMVTKLKAAS